MYCLIKLLHLISSFLNTRSLFIAYGHLSIQWIEYIFLSSLALNAVLLTSTANKLCFLPLNLCCDFSMNLLFFTNSFWFSLRLSASCFFLFSWFISFPCWVVSKQCSQSSNLSFHLMTHFFVPSAFFLHHHHLLNGYMLLVSMW